MALVPPVTHYSIIDYSANVAGLASRKIEGAFLAGYDTSFSNHAWMAYAYSSIVRTKDVVVAVGEAQSKARSSSVRHV